MANQFQQFQLSNELIAGLSEIGFTEPTEIQGKVIPTALKGKDIIAQSQTGSGKTHAFLLPILEKIDINRQEVQAVVVAPSRELATQIRKNMRQFVNAAGLDISIGFYIGGSDKQNQIKHLNNKQPQVVIGTPGRIYDLAKENVLNLKTTQKLVIDEADMALDMGFLPDVVKIIAKFDGHPQTMVFSATIPQALEVFLGKNLESPVREIIKPASVISENVDNWLISAKNREIPTVITQIMKIMNPFMSLIFANTKKEVEEIGNKMNEAGLKTAIIHGDIPSRKRAQIMREIRNLDYQYIVASDLVARGIDIPEISLVVNANIPSQKEFYIHRVGRTGRNKMKGTAITLYQPNNQNVIGELEALGINFKPMKIRDGQIVESHDRNRRVTRKASQQEMSPTIRGLAKKKSKKVKPGYKNKIKSAMKREKLMNQRIEQRQNERQARKQRKRDY